MLHHITLHLARNKQFPEGSSRYGYDITAPLDAQGHLDQEEWSDKRAYCRVRRFWADEGERSGCTCPSAGRIRRSDVDDRLQPGSARR